MPKASRTEVFEMSCQPFYDVIVDYKSYPEFAEGVVGTRMIKTRDDGARVKFFVKMIREVNYTLDLYHDEPNRVWWNLVRGDLFEKMDGEWVLQQKGKKLEVTYNLDVEAKLHIPTFIMKQLVGFNMPRVIHSFHERARALEG